MSRRGGDQSLFDDPGVLNAIERAVLEEFKMRRGLFPEDLDAYCADRLGAIYGPPFAHATDMLIRDGWLVKDPKTHYITPA